MTPGLIYHLLVLSVLALFGLVLLLYIFLLLQRGIASVVARYTKRRQESLSPLLYRALSNEASVPELVRVLRPFDRAVVRAMLLRLALDLRGEEAEKIAGLFRELGLLEIELVHLRRGSPRRRAAASANLGALGLREALPALLRALDDRDTWVRMAAARAVGELGGREALAVLPRVLEDPSPAVARQAEEILALRGREVVDDILAYVCTTASASGRRAGVDVLGWLRVPEAAELLLELVRAPDPELRVKATKAAGAIGDPRFLEAFHGLLEDPHWEARCQAAKALGSLGSPSSISRLRSALRDRYWWVRFYAAVALAEFGERGEAALRDALSDPDARARDMARYLLDRGRAVPVVP